MINTFDKYYRHEIPDFILCNPDNTQLGVLNVGDTSCALRYNDTSDLSFTAYDRGVNELGEQKSLDIYDKVNVYRQIYIKDLGYFIITEVSEETDGVEIFKKVSAKSAQYELSYKTIDYLNGTYKLYDATTNFDEDGNPTTIMGYIMYLAPGWQMDEIDSTLNSIYRTFDVSGKTLLDFLYNDLEKAYQCIVDFDFENRKISLHSVSSLLESPTMNTDIYLSFDNLMTNFEMNEDSDDIITKLYVSGQDLDIRQVNPLGTNYIINIDYYKNSEWMSDGLIAALNSWKAAVQSNETAYSQKIASLTAKRQELTILLSEKTTLEGEKKVYDNVIAVRIAAGYTDDRITIGETEITSGMTYSELVAASEAKGQEIAAKQAEIEAKQSEITTLIAEISAISANCSLGKYLSKEQLIELSPYLKEGTYSNDNFVITDKMTDEEIMGYASELYNEAKLVSTNKSQPSYSFDIDANNYLFLPDFTAFTNQTKPGCIVHIEKDEDVLLHPILLEMEFSWDDETSFSMSFGNRFKLNDIGAAYEDLITDSATTAGQVQANWESIVDFSKNYKSEIEDLINNAFDVSLKRIISSSNEEQTWDSSGMTFRKVEGTGYSDEQLKITSNTIAFTRDAWNTVVSAIGKITLANGGTMYGICAEAIIGRLIAGENLVIANEGNTFRIDENGLFFRINNGDTTTEYSISQYIDKQVNDLSLEITSQFDGKIDSFYQADMPYPNAENISDTASDEYKQAIAREGDLWFNTSEKSSYRYTKTEVNGVFSFTWKSIDGVPSDIYDEIDGKKAIYTNVPENGFKKDDLWLYNGNGSTVTGSSGKSYTAPNISGSYALTNDLLVATADSETYDNTKWKKFSSNIKKSNGSFSFSLTDTGMELKNGSITMATGKNTINIDATNGIAIKKGTDKTFYLDTNGNIVMKGNITAQSGNIGGFTIGSSALYNGKNSLAGTSEGVYLGTDGISIGSKTVTIKTYNKNTYTSTTKTAPAFSVDKAGSVACAEISFPNGSYIKTAEFYDWWNDNSTHLGTCTGLALSYICTSGICIASKEDYMPMTTDDSLGHCGFIGVGDGGELILRTPPTGTGSKNNEIELNLGDQHLQIHGYLDDTSCSSNGSIELRTWADLILSGGGGAGTNSNPLYSNLSLADGFVTLVTRKINSYTTSTFMDYWSSNTGYLFCGRGIYGYNIYGSDVAKDRVVFESELKDTCFVGN